MKKKYYLLITAVLLITVSIVGTSLAAISATGSKVQSELAAPTLRLNLSSGVTSAENEAALQSDGGTVMPGDELGESSFVVTNRGELPFYVKITVSHYWTEDGQKLIGRGADSLEMEAGEGWIKAAAPLVGSSRETQTFYYARPVQSGESVNFSTKVIVSDELDNSYQGLGITVDARAEGVQFVSGENSLNATGIIKFAHKSMPCRSKMAEVWSSFRNFIHFVQVDCNSSFVRNRRNVQHRI